MHIETAAEQTSATQFIKANDASLVVTGRAIGNGGEGAVYTLKNGQSYRLSVDECRALPEGYPKWDL